MGKYPEVDLNLKPEVREQMEKIADKKADIIKELMTKFLDENDVGFVQYCTVTPGCNLGEFYDSMFTAQPEPEKAFPHLICFTLLSNGQIHEIMRKNPSDCEDAELVIAFGHEFVISAIIRGVIEDMQNIVNGAVTNLTTIRAEMDKRGIAPVRAVLKPLKMNTKYKIITDQGEFLASYDDAIIFTLTEVEGSEIKAKIPAEPLHFIGNIMSDGSVHHIDDLPIFSTTTKLLFGKINVPIIQPTFVSGIVKGVVELNEIS